MLYEIRFSAIYDLIISQSHKVLIKVLILYGNNNLHHIYSRDFANGIIKIRSYVNVSIKDILPRYHSWSISKVIIKSIIYISKLEQLQLFLNYIDHCWLFSSKGFTWPRSVQTWKSQTARKEEFLFGNSYAMGKTIICGNNNNNPLLKSNTVPVSFMSNNIWFPLVCCVKSNHICRGAWRNSLLVREMD